MTITCIFDISLTFENNREIIQFRKKTICKCNIRRLYQSKYKFIDIQIFLKKLFFNL